MKRDLDQLLRSADGSAGAAHGPAANFGNAVRRRFAARRRMRRIAGASIPAAIVAVVVLVNLPIERPGAETAGVRDVQLDAPTVSNAPVIQHTPDPTAMAMVRVQTGIILAQRMTASQQSRTKKTPPMSAQAQRDRAALILLYDADEHLREHRTPEALAAYRRTVELFPMSQWADVAKEKLRENPS